MLNLFKTLFRKSVSKTIKEAGDLVENGWSHRAPIICDDKGNIVARCADAAIASVPRANPKARGIIQAVANAANTMHGINVLGEINRYPDMTQEKMVGYFRQAEVIARKVK